MGTLSAHSTNFGGSFMNDRQRLNRYFVGDRTEARDFELRRPATEIPPDLFIARIVKQADRGVLALGFAI